MNSNPAGITCGATCSYGFTPNTTVTLTAVADVGSTFIGWFGGGCSGTGTCTVTMDTAKGVAAAFDAGGANGSTSSGGGGGGGGCFVDASCSLWDTH